MRVLAGCLVLILIVAVNSCSKDQDTRLYSFTYSFRDSLSGWEADFADYPEDSATYHLQAGLETLPYNINTDSTKNAIRLSGNNHSDDLFMFIKRKLSGLRKNTTYQVLFNVKLASNAPTGTLGAGGAPGESVYVKVGASTIEPEKQLVDGFYVMNIDKGDQSTAGENMVVVGNIGVASTTVNYAIITRFNSSANAVYATTNDAGELWLIIGTDSGYEGITTLYYTQVDVYLNQTD
ncbi:MAG TPA: hypothetical protein PK325_03555 [Cyclobacteriaceae bacterium]|nr:hypothetical protein [Cyclobacteriaceae bacterium]HMV07890.1 hypothetical protein [Cyclobacteriaceae bacterium]HMV88158.1 hypothetical protein [Cyclobacteriaceae bacterium]HMW99024.1 hypothetical protein [Cyclobacteriaceae bacterium]HMX48342.1 hypothetical protein [Cyclobacteriaceae bacterium]